MVQIFRKASAGINSEERQHEFDPNPVLLMATTILQYNKAQSRDFIVHLEQCLQIILGRFDVQTQTLRELLRVTLSLYKRSVPDQTGTSVKQKHANTIVNLLVDTLSDVLRAKARTTLSTLVALIEVRTLTLLWSDMNSILSLF